MRVLILATDVYTRGGIARYASSLVETLGDLVGAENIRVLALLGSGGPQDLANRFRIQHVTLASRPHLVDKLGFAAKAIQLGQEKFDLTICTHLALAQVAAAIRYLYRTPFWVVCHGEEAWQRNSALKDAALQQADLILAASEFTASKLRAALNIRARKVKLLYNAIPDRFARMLLSTEDTAPGLAPAGKVDNTSGIDQSCHSERQQKIPAFVGSCERRDSSSPLAHPSLPRTARRNDGSEPFSKLLLSVGSLSKVHSYKGFERVIRALPQVLSQIPCAYYVIVGSGDDRKRLEGTAREIGVRDRVTFAGEVSDSELAAYYRACDVFVLPSQSRQHSGRWEGEGFGRVYIEAALAGKPVVGSREGGAAEAVLHEKTGFLVDPSSVEEITAAVCLLLQKPDVARHMGSEGRRWALRNFTAEQMRGSLRSLLGSSCSAAVPAARRQDAGATAVY